MGKSLCKLKKSCKEEFNAYAALVNEPRHICTKCGRAANSKKNLCKARKIEETLR